MKDEQERVQGLIYEMEEMLKEVGPAKLCVRSTCAVEGDTTFLDLRIFPHEQHLATNLFRKPTATNALLEFSSFHPWHTKVGVPTGQFLRVRRNCTLDHEFSIQARELSDRFSKRGYPKRVLSTAYQRARGQDQRAPFFQEAKIRKQTRFTTDFNNSWKQVSSSYASFIRSTFALHELCDTELYLMFIQYEQLDPLVLPDDIILATLDVEALYTNINHDLGTAEALENFGEELNTNQCNIRLTSYYSTTSVDFLDLRIMVRNRINTTLFHKSTATNNVLRYSSFHPSHLRNSIPKGQFLCLRRNCSTMLDFQEEARSLTNRFQECGYPRKIIAKAFMTKIKRRGPGNTAELLPTN
ncbi:unnamed protein product [Ranitomeya imitator]|uniref:Helix-turn-helix domain-containing protein n=1 Tax=Ranitomeya imitator TaxID=111125 RepID=A0ABN9LYZ8_9NEOB|nr:unnamed protein product [Ranitomeya imitator]